MILELRRQRQENLKFRVSPRPHSKTEFQKR